MIILLISIHFITYHLKLFFRNSEVVESNFQQNLQMFHNSKDISQTSTSSSSVTSHPPIIPITKSKTSQQKPSQKAYNCPQSPLSKMKVHTSSSFPNGNNLLFHNMTINHDQ